MPLGRTLTGDFYHFEYKINMGRLHNTINLSIYILLLPIFITVYIDRREALRVASIRIYENRTTICSSSTTVGRETRVRG